MSKLFKNANIYVEGKGIIKTDLLFDKQILQIGNDLVGEAILLPEDAVVVPGFIDQHIHGAGGADAMDGTFEALNTIATTVAKEGTTSFLATTMTQSPSNISKAMSGVKDYIKKDVKDGARLLGIHLEGPFISTKSVGAQPIEYVAKMDSSVFDKYNNESGNNIKVITLAPEVENATEFISHIASQGIVVSIGHTAGKYNDVENAIKNGAKNVTHTYNAQSPLHHRDIGTVGSAMLFDELNCELIADTIHVSIPAIKLLIKNKPKQKVTLITDAMRAKGMPDGISELGGNTVYVKNGEARLEDGTLAGSVLKMNVAIKNLVEKIGIPYQDAIDFATINPARNLGVDNLYGSIKEGKIADFTILDKNFNVLFTIKNGEIIYKA